MISDLNKLFGDGSAKFSYKCKSKRFQMNKSFFCSKQCG